MRLLDAVLREGEYDIPRGGCRVRGRSVILVLDGHDRGWLRFLGLPIRLLLDAAEKRVEDAGLRGMGARAIRHAEAGLLEWFVGQMERHSTASHRRSGGMPRN